MSETVAPMTSRERVLAALRREPVDRTPVVNPTSVATVELMDMVDAPFPAANREPELMARLAATGHTELGFDSVTAVELRSVDFQRLMTQKPQACLKLLMAIVSQFGARLQANREAFKALLPRP